MKFEFFKFLVERKRSADFRFQRWGKLKENILSSQYYTNWLPKAQ